MGGGVKYHREATRFMQLAQQATTPRLRESLLQQARQHESVALELELIAQREEAERLTP